jgi:hypothetical protein
LRGGPLRSRPSDVGPTDAAAALAQPPGDRPPAVPAVSRCRARQHHGQAVNVTPIASVAGRMSQTRAAERLALSGSAPPASRAPDGEGQARNARGEPPCCGPINRASLANAEGISGTLACDCGSPSPAGRNRMPEPGYPVPLCRGSGRCCGERYRLRSGVGTAASGGRRLPATAVTPRRLSPRRQAGGLL